MKWRNTVLSLIFLLLMSSGLLGQIVVPQKVEVGEELVATVSASMPEGATFDGGWAISCSNGTACTARYQFLKEDNKIGIWAKPGKYQLTFSGFWLLLEEKTFTDGDGNQIKIKSYISHGFINEETAFEVTGNGDPPVPPNPTPAGPYQIMMFYDADQLDNYPQDQRALLTSLAVRKRLQSEGHTVLEILEAKALRDGVPSKFKPYVDAVLNDPLPRVAFAPMDGGKVVDFVLPANEQKLRELLKNSELAHFYKVDRERKQ